MDKKKEYNKTVTIVIACRNEENFICRCLDSIMAQNYPQDLIEVLVVDGMSDDGTREIVKKYSKDHDTVKLLVNKHKLTPYAMNIGLKTGTGAIKILVNAHSIIDENFVKNSVETLRETGADAVGGTLKTVNEGEELINYAIPLAADSIFGTGGKRYRSRTEADFVNDTLPYCAYPQETLDKFGYIDEALTRDQDEELNYRILNNGGRIFYSPEIKSTLFIRSNLKKLWKQHYQYGYFKPLVVRKVGGALTWRQMIPGLFVFSLGTSLFLSLFSKRAWKLFKLILLSYCSVNLYFSHEAAKKYEENNLLKEIFISFATLHCSYGTGYLKGINDFIIKRVDEESDSGLEMELTR